MHKSALLLAAAGLGLALAGCATPKVPERIEDARLPTEQFRAKVEPRPEEIQLAIHSQGVSPNQAAALTRLVEDWRETAGAPIRIHAPTRGPDPAVTYRMGESTRAFLISQGVPPQAIELVGYDAEGAADAPLLVGYLRHEVVVPKCGQAWTNLARSAMNEVHPNFGCSVTANMAAQIADPSDLLGPRRMDPADAQRREQVLKKYREGSVTSAQQDERADGAVSRVVK